LKGAGRLVSCSAPLMQVKPSPKKPGWSRKSLVLYDSMWDAITRVRIAEHMVTETEAIRWLLRAALDTRERKRKAPKDLSHVIAIATKSLSGQDQEPLFQRSARHEHLTYAE
jgi:hypothetical protein